MCLDIGTQPGVCARHSLTVTALVPSRPQLGALGRAGGPSTGARSRLARPWGLDELGAQVLRRLKQVFSLASGVAGSSPLSHSTRPLTSRPRFLFSPKTTPSRRLTGTTARAGLPAGDSTTHSGAGPSRPFSSRPGRPAGRLSLPAGWRRLHTHTLGPAGRRRRLHNMRRMHTMAGPSASRATLEPSGRPARRLASPE